MAIGDLCSLEELKAHLKITEDQTSEDALLERAISAASAMISKYTERQLIADAEPRTEYHSGTGRSVLFLNEYPIKSIDSLSIDGRSIPAFAGSAKAPCFVFRNNLLTVHGTVFARGSLNIAVIYTAGYSADDIPADLKQACIEIASLRYVERDRIGMSSKGIEGQTTSYVMSAMPDSAKKILNEYLRITPRSGV